MLNNLSLVVSQQLSYIGMKLDARLLLGSQLQGIKEEELTFVRYLRKNRKPVVFFAKNYIGFMYFRLRSSFLIKQCDVPSIYSECHLFNDVSLAKLMVIFLQYYSGLFNWFSEIRGPNDPCNFTSHFQLKQELNSGLTNFNYHVHMAASGVSIRLQNSTGIICLI